MRASISFTLLLLIATAVSAVAQGPKPVAERLAAQNALFDEQYESSVLRGETFEIGRAHV